MASPGGLWPGHASWRALACFFGAWLVLFCDLSHPVALAEGLGLNVSPGAKRLRVVPGGEGQQTYTVTNRTDGELAVTVTGEVFVPQRVPIGAPASWLRASPLEFTLALGEARTVTYQVLLPEDATGEHLAMVYYTGSKPGLEGIGVHPRIGLPLYVVAEGTEVVKGSVSALRIVEGALSWRKKDKVAAGMLQIAGTFVNRGNVHLRPMSGWVRLESVAGAVVGTRQLPLRGEPIFQGHSHEVRVAWSDLLLKPGAYRLVMEIPYGAEYEQRGTASASVDFRVRKGGALEVEEPTAAKKP